MGDTSIEKAFQIFDLLAGDQSIVTAEEVSTALSSTRSTTYRYLKALCDAGFLMQFARGRYALGPRIIELERKIQLSDPLLNASRPPMEEHANDCLDSALILCGLWGERVLCLYQADAESTAAPGLKLRRARGLPFPLFQGAASLSILASLPNNKLRSIYLSHSSEIERHGQGSDWTEFRRNMQAIRSQGHVRTSGTFGSNLTAFAMPIKAEDGHAIGSIARILPGTSQVPEDEVLDGLRLLAEKIRYRLYHHLLPTGGIRNRI